MPAYRIQQQDGMMVQYMS